MSGRPMVLPEAYSGEGDWDQWIYHFENVAAVNKWEDGDKLLWLKVRLTGRAQTAFQRFADDTKESYSVAKKALGQRFEPPSRKDRYQAEFQTRRRKKAEGWPDFAEELRVLVDRAYPDLEDKAREQLALNHFLAQLEHPQVAFSVKQQRPKTLDEAVTATLEMESYLGPKTVNAGIASVGTAADPREETVAAVGQGKDDTMTEMMKLLLTRMDRIEKEVASTKSRDLPSRSGDRGGFPDPTRGRPPIVTCWICDKKGHISRDCRSRNFRPAATGKLATLGVTSRSCEGDKSKAHTNQITISTLPSPTATAYKVCGEVNGTSTSFILDTGAAVSLLRSDVWKECQQESDKLEPWTRQRLVGVDGTPLKVLGCTHIELMLAGERFQMQALVIDSLTCEGIVGLDFLQEHCCSIDIPKGLLHFADRGVTVPVNNTPCSTSRATVHLASRIQIPARSEMEVLASTEQTIDGGTWLLEGSQIKQCPIVVARAVVSPRNGAVTVRLLNPHQEMVTLHPGTKIARLETLDSTCVASAGTETEKNRVAKPDVPEVSAERRRLLWEIAQNSGSDLMEDERCQLFQLLLAYADLFSGPGTALGRTNRLKHAVYTGDAQPIRQHVRRIPPFRKKEVSHLLQDMLQKDVIQPSSSPWASPIVLVRKKDGSSRFCVDYRKLNAVTRKDAYPLPRIDETLDTLSGSKWFTTLDLASGYWQVEMEEEDQHKTAFCTPDGLYEFKVMPFGLCNAPATFQRLMDLVLAGLQWSTCLVYLDDIIILGKDFPGHIRSLQMVLQRIRDAGLKLQPAKCVFFREEVKYLGHVVSREGVAADPSKIDKVNSWPVPRTAREVQQFLGLANYYRRFIRDFAKIAKPLHRLTERTATFKWTEDCQEAFEDLCRRLSSAPILTFPDYSKPFILDTDASDTGIGAVLSQLDEEGKEHVVAYASRLLSKAERHYCVTRRELLAVVTFTKHFRPHLLGRKFTVRTDHGSLTWLCNFKDPEGQLARWLEKLQEYDFDVVHRQGRKHCNADALSRVPCRQCGRTAGHEPNEQDSAVVGATYLSTHQNSEVRKFQLSDKNVGLYSRPRRGVFDLLKKSEREEAPRADA